MSNDPNSFDEFLATEKASLDNDARLAAEASAAQLQGQEVTRQEQLRARLLRSELAITLQRDAARVALGAAGVVRLDATIGRLFPRTSGWIISIENKNHNNGGDGYNYRSWNMVHATVLSMRGRLQTASPVKVKKRDLRPVNDQALGRVLRRSSGFFDIEEVGQAEFTQLRQQLADFVLTHSLDVT